MRKDFFTVFYMVAITAVFTVVVTVLKVATEARVAQNEQLAEHREILLALNLTDNLDLSGPEVDALLHEKVVAYAWPRSERRVYASLDAKGVPQVYAFPIGGRGFWGPIRGFLGVAADGDEIRGISFVKHSETPGLGARIDDKWFREQFKGKQIAEPEDDLYINFVREDRELTETSVHAISGATRTSMALESFLNEDLARIREVLAGGELKRVQGGGA